MQRVVLFCALLALATLAFGANVAISNVGIEADVGTCPIGTCNMPSGTLVDRAVSLTLTAILCPIASGTTGNVQGTAQTNPGVTTTTTCAGTAPTYAWTQTFPAGGSAGTFGTPAGAATAWTAPTTGTIDGTYTFTITVIDTGATPGTFAATFSVTVATLACTSAPNSFTAPCVTFNGPSGLLLAATPAPAGGPTQVEANSGPYLLTATCSFATGANTACPQGIQYGAGWADSQTATFGPAAGPTPNANPVPWNPTAVATHTLSYSITLPGGAASPATAAPAPGAAVAADLLTTVSAVAATTTAPLLNIGSSSTSWLAVAVLNDPGVQQQWTPGSSFESSASPTFPGSAPLAFVSADGTTPPATAGPLYWGNSYKIRVGITYGQAVAATGQFNAPANKFCGSKGVWLAAQDISKVAVGQANPDFTNNAAVAPTANSFFDTQGPLYTVGTSTSQQNQGCNPWLEANDVWTIPAPSFQQAVSGTGGYTTVAFQGGALNTIVAAGPVVFSPTSLVFTGAAVPAGWVASCGQPSGIVTGTQVQTNHFFNWDPTAPATGAGSCTQVGVCTTPAVPAGPPVPPPCSSTAGTNPQAPAISTCTGASQCFTPRYNPDPQVWTVTAAGGTQVNRFTSIGVGLTPTQQGSNPIAQGRLQQTNDIYVNFWWPAIGTAVGGTVAQSNGGFQAAVVGAGPPTPVAGVPGQPAITNVPSCTSTAYVDKTSCLSATNAGNGQTVTIGIDCFPSCNQGFKTSCPGGAVPASTAFPSQCIVNTADPVNGLLPLSAIGNSFATALQSASGSVLTGIYIATRPIEFLGNGATTGILNSGAGSDSVLALSLPVQQPSLPFVVSLPLKGTTAPVTTYNDYNWNSPSGTTPTVVVTPQSVFSSCVTTGANADFVSGTSLFTFTPPSLTLSRATPSGAFTINNVPQLPTNLNAGGGACAWNVYFKVVDAGGDSSVAPNAPAFYSVPYLSITPTPHTISIPNFPPSNFVFYVTQQLPGASANYNYQMIIDQSASALSVSSVVLTVAVTVNGVASSALQFIVNGAATSTFTFTGTNTVIPFQVITQTSPVNNVQVTFTSNTANTFPLNIPASFVASVVANQINVRTLIQNLVEGPWVLEPFNIELTFTPPTQNGFTVNVIANGIFELTAGASTGYQVAAGSTAALLGPFTPKLPTDIQANQASYSLPFLFSLGSTGDSSWYTITNLFSVTVNRHTLIVSNELPNLNAQGTGLNLYVPTTGQPSQQLCISPNYNLFALARVQSTDSLTLTFSAQDGSQREGIIFNPPTITLSQATPQACVTIAADNKVQWNNYQAGTFTSDVFTIDTYLGGSLAAVVQNPLHSETPNAFGGGFVIYGFPTTVTVIPPGTTATGTKPIRGTLAASPLSGSTTSFFLGESALLSINVDWLPPSGFTYQLVGSGLTFTAVTAGAGTFSPSGAQQQQWTVTFSSYAGDNSAGTPGNWKQDILLFVTGGQDAWFYDVSQTAALVLQTVTINPRVVSVSGLQTTVLVGYNSAAGTSAVNLQLLEPVVNGLTVTAVPRTTGSSVSGGLSFFNDNSGTALAVPQWTFNPGAGNSQQFQIVGNLLGDFEFTWQLSGPDRDLFVLQTAAGGATTNPATKITVGLRPAPTISTTGLQTESGVANNLLAGVTYGPLQVTLSVPIVAGETLTITPSGSDFVFTPTSVTFSLGQLQATFSVKVNPTAPPFNGQPAVSGGDSFTGQVLWSLSGSAAWKYAAPTVATPFTISYRTFTVNLATTAVTGDAPGTESPADTTIGVTRYGFVTIDLPTPNSISITPIVYGGSITFNPAVWTFTSNGGTVIHFSYTVNSVQAWQLSSPANSVDNVLNNQPSTNKVGLQLEYLLSGADTNFFQLPVQGVPSITVRRRSFHMDTYQGTSNVWMQDDSATFVVGQISPVYVMTVNAAPTTSVSITITHTNGLVVFSPATLTFTAGTLAVPFQFTFLGLQNTDTLVRQLNIVVSGTDAALYDYAPIFAGFRGLRVIPALSFSPIPSIYTDGKAEGLWVGLTAALGSGQFPASYSSDDQFTLHIGSGLPAGVYIEPDTLVFSGAALASGATQYYRIVHTNPRVFSGSRSYALTWNIKYTGLKSTELVAITAWVPQDVQSVQLARYQINFAWPGILSFDWQQARVNISRIPVAHLTLTPRQPTLDGTGLTQGGHTPGGRVIFEPAVITFSPGQQVAKFWVKAEPGQDPSAVYYRVDWTINGHVDDVHNLLEYDFPTTNGNSGSQLSTFHIGSAAAACASFLLVAVVALAMFMF